MLRQIPYKSVRGTPFKNEILPGGTEILWGRGGREPPLVWPTYLLFFPYGFTRNLPILFLDLSTIPPNSPPPRCSRCRSNYPPQPPFQLSLLRGRPFQLSLRFNYPSVSTILPNLRFNYPSVSTIPPAIAAPPRWCWLASRDPTRSSTGLLHIVARY